MDDLEGNPLHRAFLTKFRQSFDVACKLGYMIAIPHSDVLDDAPLSQSFANSHILMPSKLLKMHYTPMQATGYTDDIELDGDKLFCYVGKRKASMPKLVARILGQEIGYNVNHKEYKVIVIDQALADINYRPIMSAILAPLSPNLRRPGSARLRPRRPLRNHDDCAQYLDTCLGPEGCELRLELEAEVARFQANYLILGQYLDDAARRLKSLADVFAHKYLFKLVSRGYQPCQTVSRAIQLAVENYALHLTHDKLMGAVRGRYAARDSKLLDKLELIGSLKLTICELGAQASFGEFALSGDILLQISQLASVRTPVAIVDLLVKLFASISDALDQSVRFRRLMGSSITSFQPKSGQPAHSEGASDKLIVCSDDLIASLVFCLARAKPAHLFSLCKYLEIFGMSSIERDHAAYYAATVQLVAHYVSGFSHQPPVDQ